MEKIKRKSIHPRKKQIILERDNFKCVNCGTSGYFNSLEVDHIIKVKDGGTNDESNLQTLCYRCNMDKECKDNTVSNKYLLDLTPLDRLELIKDRLFQYRHLTYPEFKVIFTQDELFNTLRLNLQYVEDLFRHISGKKRDNKMNNNKFIEQRDKLIYILKKNNDITFKELELLLKSNNISLSYQQLAKICSKY